MVIWGVWTIRIFSRCRVILPTSCSWNSVLKWRHILTSEGGLSYSLAYVLTFPLYLTLCLLIFETTLLLMTKIGTVYAAYAGARSAVVWDSMKPNLGSDRIQQSVVSALIPFAMSGDDRTSTAGNPPVSAQRHAQNFKDSYERFGQRSVQANVLFVHYKRVAARTKIDVSIPNRKHGEDVTVKVRYRSPFLVPGIGRLLDADHAYPFEVEISSTVTLTLERPLNAQGTLGIDYQSY